MKRFIGNHPNLFYFALTFGWTWILVLGLILSGAVEDVSTPTLPFILVGLLCGISPSLAAFLIGWATGSHQLGDGFRKKAGKGLLALAALAVPVMAGITIFISHFTIRPYAPGLTAPLIAVGLVWPLFSSFGEEFGWRGYYLPQLLKKYSPVKASLILGLIWSAWHIPMDYIAYKNYGVWLVPAYLVTNFINLTLHAAVMTHLYRKGGGSLKLMILYHYTITAMAILPGAFLLFEAQPRYTVLEGIVSVSLLAALAAILYGKDARAKKGQGTARV